MDALFPFRTMAYNNGWANRRLLTACRGLSREDLVAERTGFFPSLSATLNHILIVDWFYVDAMEGGTLGPAAFADREPCKTVDALRDAQTSVDHRLIAVVEALDADDLARIVNIHRGERVQRERMDRLLLHVFEHQIHHRGQAHGMLSGTCVAPPQLDEFFSAGEAPLRAAEFAELGGPRKESGRNANPATDGRQFKARHAICSLETVSLDILAFANINYRMARLQSDATVFQAIACPTRRALLDALGAGEQHVSFLVDRLNVTQSAVSQQLGVLKSAGLVEERQEGRFRYYRARTAPLLEVHAWVERYRAQHQRSLDALGEVLNAMDDAPDTPTPPRRKS